MRNKKYTIPIALVLITVFAGAILQKLPRHSMIYWLVCGIGLIVGIALLVYGLRLKSQPNFVMVDCQVKQDIDKKNKRLLVNAQAVFVNTGQGTAYQVQARRVYASMEMPTQAEVQPALLQPNPIKVGGR